jgi:Flp pilus assembly protein TadG
MSTRSWPGAVAEREGLGLSKLNWTRARAVARERAKGWLRRLRGIGGTQLLEFALALPFLVVTAVAVVDFGRAYNTKHILVNAAREAARITVSNPLSDANGSCQGADPPCSIQAAAEAVKTYLTNASLSQASCITPGTPSSGSLATLKWTYTCDSVTLTIDRSLVVTGGPNGTVIPSAQVTLSYPYTWTLNGVIGLLVKGATMSLPTTLTTSAVMQILATG